MDNRKIIFLDLDGTLTNNEKKITKKTKEKLIEIQKQGHIIALASGRPTPGIVPVAKELELEKFGGYILAFNGGKVIDCSTNKTVFENVMDRKYVPELIRYARVHNLGLISYDLKQALVATRMDKYIFREAIVINKIPAYMTDVEKYLDFNPNKCLCTAKPEESEFYEKDLIKRFGDKLSIYRSCDFFIEIMPKGIDKAASIEKLIGLLGIARESTIACGDGLNDLSMIKYAGVGVAMENAAKEVKEVADYITASNNDDGIVQVIDKFILNN